MKTTRLGLMAVVLTGLCVNLAAAYTHYGTSVTANGGLLYWPSGSMTYRVNSQAASQFNIVQPGNVSSVIDQAFGIWESGCGFNFTRGSQTSVTNAGYDAINLVTFADTAANRSALGGIACRTILTFNSSNVIFDADILFHPDLTITTVSSSTDVRQPNAHPLLPMMLGQAGHCIAVMSSPIQSASMMRYVAGRTAKTEAGRLGTFLTRDDQIAANVASAKTGFFTGTGTISGYVTLGGAKVYGAHVVAVDAATGIVAAGNVSLGSNQGTKFGYYRIKGLPAGAYKLYAEPVDAPYASDNWEGIPSWGDYWGGDFTGGYRTTFQGGNAAPASVQVAAGGTTAVNLAVSSGSHSILPIYNALVPAGISPAQAETGSVLYQTLNVHTPIVLKPGERRTVAVNGVGLIGTTISCSDPAMTVDVSGLRTGVLGDDTEYLIFQLAVPATSAEGPRNLIFKSGAETAVMTGAIYIDPQKPFIRRNSADRTWRLME
ncbi:MAG: carboxypeptidase-like regulatory domain-containing protein [Candidatus Sumerlaeia bacterium]